MLWKIYQLVGIGKAEAGFFSEEELVSNGLVSRLLFDDLKKLFFGFDKKRKDINVLSNRIECLNQLTKEKTVIFFCNNACYYEGSSLDSPLVFYLQILGELLMLETVKTC